MYFVYLVRCNDNTLYCGQTRDLKKRIKDHNDLNNSTTKYTRGRRPIQLVYWEKKKTISIALKREREIKKLTKQEKELLIQRPKKRRI